MSADDEGRVEMLRHVSNPPNPWRESVEWLEEVPETKLEVFEDVTRSILSDNRGRRVAFDFGLNPYRGCQHACAYCEARRRHAYLGFGVGTDFDTKIVVKPRAPELLRGVFETPSWNGDVIVFSGATDCYQPLEASYRLTRGCLEVCAEYANPVAIITKGALIERDLDVLTRIPEVTTSVSITCRDPDVARTIEPFVPTPARRLKTIRRLADAGIDVGINVAPFIPGVSDEKLGDLLGAAAEAGASRAVLAFLRLPAPVDEVYAERVPWKPHGDEGMAAALFASICRRVGLRHFAPGDDAANTPPARTPRTFKRRQLGLFARG